MREQNIIDGNYDDEDSGDDDDDDSRDITTERHPLHN